MKAFFELVKMNVKVNIQYKWGYLFTILVQPVLMLINYFLFSSIFSYNNTSQIKGYGLEQMIWYYTAVNFVSIFIWNVVHTNISEKVLSGDISIDLLRPISLYRYEMASALGLRIVGIILEFVPALFLYSLIVFPSFLTATSLLKFLIVVCLAFLLYYNISYMIGMFSFLLKNSTTISVVKDVLVNLLGGVIIPLDFYPASINAALDWLPFKYIFYWPIQFFLNRFAADNVIFTKIICIQMAWILLFYLVARLMSNVFVKKYCAVGG